MKHICDGMEYSTRQDGSKITASNNYGTQVAVSELSPCNEYVVFTCYETSASDCYHVNELGDRYGVHEQLVRWFSAIA